MNIKLHPLWKYFGEPPGKNELFRLVFCEADEVVAVNENRAWLGKISEFKKNFVPFSA